MTTAFQRLSLPALLDVSDHAAELALVESLTVRPWREVETVAQGAARDARAHKATCDARAALERWHRGESETQRPPFAGPLQALRAYDESRLDGYAVPGSTFTRYQDHDTGPSERASRTVERVGDVLRCFEACLADGWTLTTYPERIALTAWQAREVLVWSTLGCPGSILPVQNPRAIVGPAVRPMLVAKHTTQRLPARGRPTGDGDAVKPHEDTSPAEVAAYASEQFGVSVPVGHVVRLRREGVVELYGRLVACGLVPRDGRMATMADTTEATGLERLDVRGWKEIVPLVDHGKRDEKTLRAWAERAENPLPLWFVGGEVCTSRADLAAWSAAELERTRRRPRGATG